MTPAVSGLGTAGRSITCVILLTTACSRCGLVDAEKSVAERGHGLGNQRNQGQPHRHPNTRGDQSRRQGREQPPPEQIPCADRQSRCPAWSLLSFPDNGLPP